MGGRYRRGARAGTPCLACAGCMDCRPRAWCSFGTHVREARCDSTSPLHQRRIRGAQRGRSVRSGKTNSSARKGRVRLHRVRTEAQTNSCKGELRGCSDRPSMDAAGRSRRPRPAMRRRRDPPTAPATSTTAHKRPHPPARPMGAGRGSRAFVRPLGLTKRPLQFGQSGLIKTYTHATR